MPRYVKKEVILAKEQKKKRTIRNKRRMLKKVGAIRAEENIRNKNRMMKKKRNCPFCPKRAT
jgi:hypothetical protein